MPLPCHQLLQFTFRAFILSTDAPSEPVNKIRQAKVTERGRLQLCLFFIFIPGTPKSFRDHFLTDS